MGEKNDGWRNVAPTSPGKSPKQKGSWEHVEVKAKHWILFTRVKKNFFFSSSLTKQSIIYFSSPNLKKKFKQA